MLLRWSPEWGDDWGADRSTARQGRGAVSPVPPRPRLLDAEALPPSPRQGRSREKRTQLLAAGLALFGEKGYEATSVDAVALRAGVAVGSFYQHFRSKR